MATPNERALDHNKENSDNTDHLLSAGDWEVVSGTISPPADALSPRNSAPRSLAGEWLVVSASASGMSSPTGMLSPTGLGSPTGMLSPTGMGSPIGSRSHTPMPTASAAAGVAASAAPTPIVAVKPDAPTAAAVALPTPSAPPSAAPMLAASVPAAPFTTAYNTLGSKPSSPAPKESSAADNKNAKEAARKKEEDAASIEKCVNQWSGELDIPYDATEMARTLAHCGQYFSEGMARLLQLQDSLKKGSTFYYEVQQGLDAPLKLPKSFLEVRNRFNRDLQKIINFFNTDTFLTENQDRLGMRFCWGDYFTNPKDVIDWDSRQCTSPDYGTLYDYKIRKVSEYPKGKNLIQFLDELSRDLNTFWDTFIAPRLSNEDPKPKPIRSVMGLTP
jgi:hypothetical protein